MVNFVQNEEGAVTVDWVVLTAAVVGLGLAAMSVVSSGVESLSQDTKGQLEEDHIIRTTFNFAPTILNKSQLMNAVYSASSCQADPDGAMVCEPSVGNTYSYYNMTNGDQWTYRERTIGGAAQEPVWINPDGEEVALADGPTLSEDIPLEDQ